MKSFFILIIYLFLFFSVTVSADNNQQKTVITIPKYFQATCDAYTGTWTGFMTDPEDLVDPGKVMPITISLYYKNGSIIGQSDSSEHKKIWAQCHNGILSNIFWGNKQACGSFSQQGMLVSRYALVLLLHYESAMAGTDFLVFLQRKNKNYNYPVPKNNEDLLLGPVKTCH